MANNEIILKLKVDGQGQLTAVAQSANKAGDALNKTGKNARTADRNLKGAAQASANGTKNFAKMAQGLTGGLVPAYAAVAAQVFALTAAFNFLKNAADLENLKAAQVSYAQATGVAIGAVTRQIQNASNGMLGFREAAQAAAIGAAKGFTTSQMTEMASGALKASAALGRSYEDTFDRLIRGVSKAEPELLDELGITLRLEKATTDYAAAIGTTADKLTAAQRSQAVYVETMKQLNANFGDVEAMSNPFVVLGKTLEKIAQDVTEKLLPVFKSIATFVNENAKAAAIAFAGLVGMVLLNISGLKEGAFKLFGAIGSFGVGIFTKTGAGVSWLTDKILSGASKAVDKLDEMEKSIKSAAEVQKSITAGAAKDLMAGGATSKTLEKISMNMEISPQAKGKLLKDLDRIEEELRETGETASKAFKGATIEGIQKLRKELQKTTKTTLSFGQKLARATAKGTVGTLKVIRNTFRGISWFAGKAATGVRKFGKAMQFAARASVILGIIGQMIIAFEELSNAPASAIKAFISFIAKIARGIQAMINFIITGINALAEKLPDWAKDKLGMEGGELITKVTFANNIEQDLTNLANEGLSALGVEGGLDALQAQEDANKKAKDEADAYRMKLEQIREEFGELGKEGKKLTEGINKQEDAFRKVGQITNAIATMPISSAMKEVAKDPALRSAFDEMIAEIGVDSLGSAYAEAIRSGSIEEVEALETAAGAYNASKSALMDSMANMSTTLAAGDPLGARLFLETLKRTAEAGDEAAAKLGQNGGLANALNKELGMSVDATIAKFRQLENEINNIAVSRNLIDIERARGSNMPSNVRAQRELGYQAELENLTLREKTALLQQHQMEMARLGDKATEEHRRREQEMKREIALQKEKVKVAEDNATVIGQLSDTAMQSLETGMTNALTSIVDGTKSVKQAFADMAIFILQEIQKIIIKLLIVRAIEAMFGGVSINSTTGLPSGMESVSPGAVSNSLTNRIPIGPPTGRYGGVFEKVPGYATGGIAKGRQAGYPAVLHGTEAVVPLPNGKEIPVNMKGAGQQNNVVVNVTVDNKGNATTSTEMQDSADAGNMGRLIAKAVQDELQNQKRSGGILSPYGVA